MKRTIIIMFICSLCISKVRAGDEPKYPTRAISSELRKDADAVMRLDNSTFTISSKSSARHLIHYAVTILNTKGDHFAEEVLYYDKLRPIRSFKGTLYDSTGNVIRKLKSNEISDYKASDGISLYDDSRVKVASLNYNSYPYTVEFEYEIEHIGLISYPGWHAQSYYRTSIESSKYTIVYPKDMDIRYKEFKLTTAAKKEIIDNKNSITWQAINLPALKRESFAPPVEEQGAYVLCAPIEISYEGYDGKIDTWNAFGEWIYNLNKDRDVLPPTVKTKVHELTDAINDPIEKARVLYEYLQKNTRYISVQLGIGGLQTFDANYVATRGYGDCKALSNYMKSLLKEAGVQAQAALVYGGDDPGEQFPDFSRNQFNHVILAIPTEKETYWMECTSQSRPFNYMGGFTDNRYALLFSPEGGKLVKTPVYTASDNVESRNARIKFDLTGNVSAIVDAQYKCVRQNDLSDLNSSISQSKLEKYLYETINIPSLQIKKFNYAAEKGSKPIINEHLELEFTNYLNISGKRIFLQPNLLNRISSLPEKLEKRRTEIVISEGATDEDKLVYEIPAGYTLESKPADANLKTAFGEFTCSVKLENYELIYTRKLVRNQGRFPAEKYNEFLDFLTAIAKSDKSKVVLVNSVVN